MSEALAAVRRAARLRAASEQRYTQALAAAAVAGHSFGRIADAAGCSRQNVEQIVKRAERKQT